MCVCVCVCVAKQDFMDVATSTVPPFAMELTAVPKSYAGTESMSMIADAFVLLCSVGDCVVIDSHRRIIFDIAVVLGYTVSSKISHMEHSLKRLVSRPLEIQNKYISKVYGTIKGVRTALEKVNYAIMTSSEPTHTIRTPHIEDHDGSLLLPRTMINTWTQGDDDESGTGA